MSNFQISAAIPLLRSYSSLWIPDLLLWPSLREIFSSLRVHSPIHSTAPVASANGPHVWPLQLSFLDVTTGGVMHKQVLKCLRPRHKAGAFFALLHYLVAFSRSVLLLLYLFFLCVASFIEYFSLFFPHYCWNLPDFHWLIFTVFIYDYFCRFHVLLFFLVTFVGFSFSNRGLSTTLSTSVCDWQVFPGKCQLSDALCIWWGWGWGALSSPSSAAEGTPAPLPGLGPSLTFSNNPNIWWWKHQTRTEHVCASLCCHGARLFIPLIRQLFMR